MTAAVRPVLKYPGGKHDLAQRISTAFGGPCRGRFYELYAGSGAVMLHRRQAGEVDAAWLSDLDAHLVNLHRQVSTRPDRVCEQLAPYRTVAWSEPRYRLHLEQVNGTDALGPAAAARLIVFNKTCFNGLYRKNRHGALNAGWNKEPAPRLPTADHILQVGAALSGVVVLQRPALEVLAEAGAGDHVYLDPPYVGTWTGYGQGGTFGWPDLADLVRAAESAASRGARVVLSHLDDTPTNGSLLAAPGPVRSLLRAWEIETVDVTGSISCDGDTRGKRREVIARIGGGA